MPHYLSHLNLWALLLYQSGMSFTRRKFKKIKNAKLKLYTKAFAIPIAAGFKVLLHHVLMVSLEHGATFW